MHRHVQLFSNFDAVIIKKFHLFFFISYVFTISKNNVTTIYVTLLSKQWFYHFPNICISNNTLFGYVSERFLNTFSSKAMQCFFAFFNKALSFFCRFLKKLLFNQMPSLHSFIQFFIHKRSMAFSNLPSFFLQY